MSSSSPATPATPTPPAPAPKKSWFHVRCGQDWGKFEAETGPMAELAFRKHFGVTGSAHGFETTPCDKPKDGEQWQSGQKAQNVAEMLKRA